MAKSQKIGVVKASAVKARSASDQKIFAALKQASSHAQKQLALQGLKLPTQSWTTTAIRNPAC